MNSRRLKLDTAKEESNVSTRLKNKLEKIRRTQSALKALAMILTKDIRYPAADECLNSAGK